MRYRFDHYTPFWRVINRTLCVLLTAVILLSCGVLLAGFLPADGAQDTFVPPIVSDYDEPMMRIGMVYGSSVRSSYSFTASDSLTYGYNLYKSAELVPLGTLPADSYQVKTASGYTLRLQAFEDETSDYETLYQRANEVLWRFDLPIFTLLTDDGMAVCLGSFATLHEAEAMADTVYLEMALGGVYPDGTTGDDLPVEAAPDAALIPVLSVYTFSDKNALLLYGSADTPLYGCDCDVSTDERRMAVWCDFDTGARIGVGTAVYESPFEFMRYKSGSYNGVSVVTVIALEKYIMGVLSEELYTSWDHEVQKTFAVIARTYALQNMTKHATYGFNLCNNTNCQVYEGCRKINENIRTAVEETKGVVLTDNGKIAAVYYATVGGGSTVNCEDSWTSARTYLKAVPTPWERYRDYGNLTSGTTWHVEMTGKQLYDKLSPYYPALKGEITDVSIDSFCTNSSYVYQLTFTDIYGNTATVKKADTIRNRLGLKSGNFVIGKAGQTVKAPVYELDCYPSVYNDTEQMQTYYTPCDLDFFSVWSDGTSSLISGLISAVFSDGEQEHDLLTEESEIITSEDAYRVNEEGRADILNGKVEMYYETVKLESTSGKTNVFVIEGKGYGHGIGICQYGAWDLACAGYDYLTILRYYFKNVTFGSVLDFV